MELFWEIFFWMIPVWTFVLIPFSTFYYEADDGMLMAGTSVNPDPVRKSRLMQALVWQLAVVIVVGATFFVTYLLLSEAEIPVVDYEGPSLVEAAKLNSFRGVSQVWTPGNFETSLLAPMNQGDSDYQRAVKAGVSETITLQVGLGTFFAALMAWVGWFLFSIFGGIGMSALPLDLLLIFKNRPRNMDAVEFAEAQLSLRERVNELVDIGEMIKVEREANPNMGKVGGFGDYFSSDKRKEARAARQSVLEFKQAVFLLEQDVEDFKACTSNYENYNALTPYIAIVLGLLSVVISSFWLIHIAVYMFPDQPLAPFLNSYFQWFDNWFPLFGVLSVAIFTIYLLFAAVKGCFKFGLRVTCITIHPMILGRTYMSSFMFNIGLVLLCALPVVQFATTAFADYARYTTINQIFGVQIENLKFFSWWWTSNIFVYIFMAFSVVSALYLMCKPRDTPPSGQELKDRLRSRRG